MPGQDSSICAENQKTPSHAPLLATQLQTNCARGRPGATTPLDRIEGDPSAATSSPWSARGRRGTHRSTRRRLRRGILPKTPLRDNESTSAAKTRDEVAGSLEPRGSVKHGGKGLGTARQACCDGQGRPLSKSCAPRGTAELATGIRETFSMQPELWAVSIANTDLATRCMHI